MHRDFKCHKTVFLFPSVSVGKIVKGNKNVLLDCIHMMPAHFDNSEKCGGCKI